MFEIKNLDFGFIILCSDMNPVALKSTIKSLNKSHPTCPIIAVVPNNIKADALKEMKECAEVFKGKDTITSLMNTGLRNCPADWGVFIMAGTWIKIKLTDKLSRFIEDDSDVLFPIVNRIYDFKNATLNGLCINKKVFKKVGPFAEQGSIPKCKEEWSLYASGLCNTKFKAILGAQVL